MPSAQNSGIDYPLQYLDKCCHSTTTMRYCVLLFGAHLGKRDVVAVGNKQWVVAEASASRLLSGDATLNDALHLLLYTIAYERYNGAKACLTVCLTLKLGVTCGCLPQSRDHP